MASYYALIRGSSERRRVAQLLGNGVVICPDVRSLSRYLNAANLRALIIQLEDSGNEEVIEMIREFRAKRPTTPVIGYCRLSPGIAHEIVRAAHAGMVDVALHDFDNLVCQLDALVRESTYQHASIVALKHLKEELPWEVHEFIEQCVRLSDQPVGVDQVAAATGVTVRTLHRRLERLALPTPGVLLVWAKLLIAGCLMQNHRQTVIEISRRVAATSTLTFRAMLKRHSSMTPTQLRAVGGFRRLVVAFREAMKRSSHAGVHGEHFCVSAVHNAAETTS